MLTQAKFIPVLNRAACYRNINLTQPFRKNGTRNLSTVHRLINYKNLAPLQQHFKQRICSLPVFYQQKHWTSSIATDNNQGSKESPRVLYNNWLDHLPSKIAPYAFLTRIDKPIGTWLLFWPCGKKKKCLLNSNKTN